MTAWIRATVVFILFCSFAFHFAEHEQMKTLLAGASVFTTNFGCELNFPDGGSLLDASQLLGAVSSSLHISGGVNGINNTTTSKAAIQRILLLGERHSGTNFVNDLLEQCFPDHINDERRELNFKHWYQPTPEYIIDVMQREEANTTYEAGPFRGFEVTLRSWQEIAYQISGLNATVAKEEALRDTHFIMMVRDPYEWMEAMRRGPYHWSNHIGSFKQNDGGRWLHVPLTWRHFVTRPLRFKRDTPAPDNVVCQKGYLSGMVQPCVSQQKTYIPEGFDAKTVPGPGELPWAARDPMYEMHPNTHEPFANPMAFREYKLQMMLDVQKHWNVGGFQVVRYEDLSTEYLTNLVQSLSNLLGGVQPKCDATSTKVHSTAVKNKNPGYRKWIMENANWRTEMSVGYNPV